LCRGGSQAFKDGIAHTSRIGVIERVAHARLHSFGVGKMSILLWAMWLSGQAVSTMNGRRQLVAQYCQTINTIQQQH